MLGTIGIVVALILIVYLVYKGANIIVSTFLCTLIVILTNALPITASFSDTYFGGVAQLVKNLFGLTIAGTLLGELYLVSGAAKSLAQASMRLIRGKDGNRSGVFATITALFVASLLLAYGGIQSVALSLLMIPLSIEMFREADIPTELIPALIMGSGSPALCAPGCPQLQNSIPQALLGTTPTAALIPGIASSLFMVVFNIWFLWFCAKRLKAAGVKFRPLPSNLQPPTDPEKGLPSVWRSIIPFIIVFVTYNIFDMYLVFSLLIGTVVGIVLLYGHLDGLKGAVKTLGDGAIKSCFVTMAAASMGGLATVISSTGSFSVLLDKIAASAINPNVLAMIAIMVVVALCGSGPTAISVATPLFKDIFIAKGMSMSALHRIVSVGSLTFDSLPTNPVFVAITTYTGLTAKESYKYAFITTVLAPSISTIIVVVLVQLFPALA